ncbi:MAG: amidohydrolase family protein [Candidatus Rokubacteria bacterium]|nr:amidohydrolase family protein [Candidatus Rokubacteria bacterium]
MAAASSPALATETSNSPARSTSSGPIIVMEVTVPKMQAVTSASVIFSWGAATLLMGPRHGTACPERSAPGGCADDDLPAGEPGDDRSEGVHVRVLPSMQPTHCTSDMRWAPERLGPERLEGAYAWRSLLDTGAIIAGGSDFPVEDPNPFHGIYAAITRRPLAGGDPGWQPHQRMTREEAMRAFTVWNAYASGQEAELGSLEPGKRADLVVLDDDPFTCPEDRVKEIAPVATLVGGEVASGTLAESRAQTNA